MKFQLHSIITQPFTTWCWKKIEFVYIWLCTDCKLCKVAVVFCRTRPDYWQKQPCLWRVGNAQFPWNRRVSRCCSRGWRWGIWNLNRFSGSLVFLEIRTESFDNRKIKKPAKIFQKLISCLKKIQDKFWKIGPSLPIPLSGSRIVESTGRESLYLTGGTDHTFTTQSSIYKLDFEDLDRFINSPTESSFDSSDRPNFPVKYAWKELDRQLPAPITDHVAFLVPDGTTVCTE